MRKHSLFVIAIMSIVCFTFTFQANAEDPLQSAQNRAKGIIDQGKKLRATGPGKTKTESQTQSALLQCNGTFPMDLLTKRGKDWRVASSPELKDQYGNQVKTVVYVGQDEYGANYQSFICLMDRWLSLGDSMVDPGTELFPQSLLIDNQGAYFLHSSKAYWGVRIWGVRISDISKAKSGDHLSSRTWLRANPEFASMLVVDFPKGADRNEPRVAVALEAMRGANLLGRTPYEDSKMRDGVSKVVASKLRDVPKDKDIHVKLYNFIASNSDEIGYIWDEINGAVHIPINLKEVRTAN